MTEIVKILDNLLIRAGYLLAQEDPVQARACLEQILDIFHKNDTDYKTMNIAASASLMLGTLYEQQGQTEKAFHYMKQAVRLSPGRADCRLYLARISFCLASRGHDYLWKKALQNLRKAVELDATIKPAADCVREQYGIKKEAV